MTLAHPQRVFTAEPAKRERVPLLIGIASPSGGGKTYSALRLATGIQRVMPGEVCLIDTENRRALHYADKFRFTHIPFNPPFGPLAYLEAIRFAAKRSPSVIIVDSMSHEHVGEGGYLDIAESTITRIAGDDYAKRERAKFIGWAKAGPQRTAMIEGIKQIGGNMIFCWRAKEKVKPQKNSQGRVEPVEMGLMPIGGEEWIYEMTLQCMLPPRSDGVPNWSSQHAGERMMMKLPVQFKELFADNPPLSEDIGEKMAVWAAGGPTAASPTRGAVEIGSANTVSESPPNTAGAGNPAIQTIPAPAPEESEELLAIEKALSTAAEIGFDVFRDTWNTTPAEKRAPFVSRRASWMRQAKEVDQSRLALEEAKS